MAQPYIGEIRMFGGSFAIRGWALCNGQLLPISSNSALFSILGTVYGGDGRTTFGLPDFRGRVPLAPGSGPGLPSYRLGQKDGNPTTTLIASNLPPHGHTAGTLTVGVSSQEGSTDEPEGQVLAAAADDLYGTAPAVFETMAAGSVQGSTGNNPTNNSSFSNQPPYLAVTFLIALVGIFPSRN